ncbi:MAG: hypothetical protein EOP08_17600 [Proteobacteria bacterium]|nr:MAG: hypothetical protein EOP08_17600 [Pseudomonadota bacterium]
MVNRVARCGRGIERDEFVVERRAPLARERLVATGRHLVEFDDAQLGAFAGNMLEVLSHTQGRALVLSATAWASLDPSQRFTLEEGTGVVVVGHVPLIELRGGGSVRCMLAEVP